LCSKVFSITPPTLEHGTHFGTKEITQYIDVFYRIMLI